MQINLGDEVECIASGFRGIALSRHEYLNGCIRFEVQPKCKKGETNKHLDAYYFDQQQLKVVKKDKLGVKHEYVEQPKAGGNRDNPPSS